MGEPRGEALELDGIPAPVRALVDALAERGFEAYLVGGCVRDCLSGSGAADFDLATAAPVEAVLEIFPRAIPIGLRHGTVMVPTRAGPVDVTSFRAGPRIEDDLAHRDFTVNAMAYDPRRGVLVDPEGGRTDLAKGVLRAVGAAADRLREDPLRALRAARLLATRGFEIDPAVETAMASLPRSALARVPRERIRRELELLLLAPRVGEALALLRRTRVEEALAPGAAPDAAAVVPRLPLSLELRLAGWLRGARPAAVLRGLRFPRRTTERVDRLLRLHPLERAAPSPRRADVRRLLRRTGEDGLRALLSLRAAELGAGSVESGADAARTALAELSAAVDRVHREGTLALQRADLALDGRGVMEALGIPAGPAVGRALAHLTECVIEDPACNTRERLTELLRRWWDRPGRPRAIAAPDTSGSPRR